MGIADDIGGHFGSLGKQLGQSIVQAPKDVVKTVGAQVGIEIKDKEKNKEVPQAQQHADKPQIVNPEVVAQPQKDNEDFVKSLYGVEAQKPAEAPLQKASVETGEKPKNPQEAAFVRLAEQYPNKSPEELRKILSLQQRAHQESYYQPLTTAPKRPEEAQEEQERAAERVERLEMEDLQEKKKKDEKAKPLPQEATKTEAPMGAG